MAGFTYPGLPLQPVRWPGTRHWSRGQGKAQDRMILLPNIFLTKVAVQQVKDYFILAGFCGEVQRHLWHVLQDQCQRERCPPALEVLEGQAGRLPGQRDQVELHQVCHQQGGAASLPLLSHRRSHSQSRRWNQKIFLNSLAVSSQVMWGLFLGFCAFLQQSLFFFSPDTWTGLDMW